jgi:hypothetical protein
VAHVAVIGAGDASADSEPAQAAYAVGRALAHGVRAGVPVDAAAAAARALELAVRPPRAPTQP